MNGIEEVNMLVEPSVLYIKIPTIDGEKNLPVYEGLHKKKFNTDLELEQFLKTGIPLDKIEVRSLSEDKETVEQEISVLMGKMMNLRGNELDVLSWIESTEEEFQDLFELYWCEICETYSNEEINKLVEYDELNLSEASFTDKRINELIENEEGMIYE